MPPRFLSSFSPDQSSIANFKEGDFSFPDRLPPQPSKSDFSLTSSHIESVRATAHSPNESMVTVDPREEDVIPIPLIPTGHAYHIDVLAPKSLESPISPVHYRQPYDPQYKLPPLCVLPPEFSRKTKTTKRKKERERNEVLTMGVSRWRSELASVQSWQPVWNVSRIFWRGTTM